MGVTGGRVAYLEYHRVTRIPVNLYKKCDFWYAAVYFRHKSICTGALDEYWTGGTPATQDIPANTECACSRRFEGVASAMSFLPVELQMHCRTAKLTYAWHSLSCDASVDLMSLPARPGRSNRKYLNW